MVSLCMLKIKEKQMEKRQKIASVIQTLINLFADKDRLIGFGDWDAFVGCILELQNVLRMLEAEEAVAMAKAADQGTSAAEGENDGKL